MNRDDQHEFLENVGNAEIMLICGGTRNENDHQLVRLNLENSKFGSEGVRGQL